MENIRGEGGASYVPVSTYGNLVLLCKPLSTDKLKNNKKIIVKKREKTEKNLNNDIQLKRAPEVSVSKKDVIM